MQENESGLTASLALAGVPCNAYGVDISNLTVTVTYETSERCVARPCASWAVRAHSLHSLHVSISDTNQEQFTLPSDYFPRPANETTLKESSDLEFNYESTPFAFWITRASNGDVLFDTRNSSLPTTSTSALGGEPLNDFKLVFEDQYLEVRFRICTSCT